MGKKNHNVQKGFPEDSVEHSFQNKINEDDSRSVDTKTTNKSQVMKKAKKKLKWSERVQGWIKEYAGIKTLFNLVSGTNIELFMSIFINLRYYEQGNTIADWNMFISFLLLMLLTIFMITILKLNQSYFEGIKKSKNKKKKKNKNQFYSFISEGGDTNNDFGKFFNIYSMLKDPVLAACVVLFYDFPPLQVASTAILMIFLSYKQIRNRPLSDNLECRCSQIITLSFALINTCFLVQVAVSLRGLKPDSKLIEYCGYPVIALLGLIIICNSLPGIREMFKQIRDFFKCKKKGKDDRRGVDSPLPENIFNESKTFNKNKKKGILTRQQNGQKIQGFSIKSQKQRQQNGRGGRLSLSPPKKIQDLQKINKLPKAQPQLNRSYQKFKKVKNWYNSSK